MSKPRTQKEALLHIQHRLAEGTLGAVNHQNECMYRSGDKNCAIGCLFTPEQLDWIELYDMNEGTGVEELKDFIGMKNMLHVSGGLSINELSDIQEAHDRWAYNKSEYERGLFVELLKEMIAREK